MQDMCIKLTAHLRPSNVRSLGLPDVQSGPWAWCPAPGHKSIKGPILTAEAIDFIPAAVALPTQVEQTGSQAFAFRGSQVLGEPNTTVTPSLWGSSITFRTHRPLTPLGCDYHLRQEFQLFSEHKKRGKGKRAQVLNHTFTRHARLGLNGCQIIQLTN